MRQPVLSREPAPAPVRHRAAAAPAQLVRRMVPPLIAVASVAGVIGLLVVLNSQPTPPGPGPGAVAQLPAVASRTAPVPTPDLGSPTPAPSATSTLPVREPSASQAPAAPATAKPEAIRASVTVLNNSRETGLAHRVAARLRAAGWTIRQTGNFRGRIRASTAYYPAGGYAAAATLARQFPQIRRVLPRFAGLPGSGLTLVLTRDWTT